MCVCGGGEVKRKVGVHGWWRKKKENKKEKRNGEWGLRVWWEKKGSKIERRKKN